MNKKELHYDWLKHRYKWSTIAGLLDIPILILLWYLEYHTSFWILLFLIITNTFLIVQKLNKFKKIVGLEDW